MHSFEGSQDRRTQLRVQLRCKVHFLRQGSSAQIHGETRDISSGGFYCFADEPLTLGEILVCDLIMAAIPTGRKSQPLTLHSKVEVLRVEEGKAGFGMGCRIQDYSIAS